MSLHDHQRQATGGQRALRIALLVTIAMMAVEFVAGWISGSLALLADAAHMLADASALGLSLFAAWFAERPATAEKTYGYYRTEILAALANGIALWLIVFGVGAKALQRLEHSSVIIDSGLMMAVALAGLIANLISGWVLMDHRTQSLNIQGAWLNVMSDALGSLGVVVAGALIRWRGWMVADPIASLLIGILIAASSWNLVKQSVNILLEGTPSHLRIPDVVEAMRSVAGVHEVHDVHLWTITTGMDAMSGHVIIDDVHRSAQILSELNARLSRQFHILHTTFQLEPPQHACQMSDASPPAS